MATKCGQALKAKIVMKRFLILALICSATLVSNAALFEFKSATQKPVSHASSDTWAVDFGTARQWYVAWASSADMLYRHVIQTTTNTVHRTPRLTVLDTVVFTGISLLMLAAAASVARSFAHAMAMRRQTIPVQSTL